jgi:hypothetical protein
MGNLNSKLVAETFTELVRAADIDGIKYYRDALLARYDLSEWEVKALKAISSTSFVLAAQYMAIKSMKEVCAMSKVYVEAELAEKKLHKIFSIVWSSKPS